MFYHLRKYSNHFLKYLLSFPIANFFKPGDWYWATYKYAGALTYLRYTNSADITKTFAVKHAQLMSALFCALTNTGKPFPIPIKATGLEVFDKPRPDGFLLVSIHLPLFRVALRYMLENNLGLTAVITQDHHIKKNGLAVWGINERIPALCTGPFVLNQAKSILEKGGSVVTLVDADLGYELRPNIFRFAAKLNTPIIFFVIELTPEGSLDISFFESAVSGLPAEEMAALQVAELKEHTRGIFERYKYLKYPSKGYPAHPGAAGQGSKAV